MDSPEAQRIRGRPDRLSCPASTSPISFARGTRDCMRNAGAARDGWTVARGTRSQAQKGTGRVFSDRVMPDGSVVHELDRTVHEKALRAAQRKLKELTKPGVGRSRV